MRTVRVVSQAGADGVLHLEIPVSTPNVEYEVVVVLQPKLPTAAPGWPPHFIEQTAGSIQDETFQRHEQGTYEDRLGLD